MSPPQEPAEPLVVRSWDELVGAVYADSFNARLGRWRSPFVFRGQSSDYPLCSGLLRLSGGCGEDGAPARLPDLERHLLRSFRKYAHREVSANATGSGLRADASDWQWVSIAQHHGLPTRLLDWSYSPFVAMHFATASLEEMDRDGVLWCVNSVAARRWLPPALGESLDAEGTHVFTVEMLEAKVRSFAALEGAGRPEEDFVVFFEPPSLDPRIVNQVALFSFLSRPDTRLDDWLQAKARGGCPEIYKKIILPAALKWEVRDKLDQANITERVLFPGLDGLSRWLRRWYLPQGAHSQLDPGRGEMPIRVPEAMG